MKGRRIELWYLLLAVLGVFFTINVYSIYEKEGWHGVIRYFVILVIAYFFLQRLGARAQKSAIADCMSMLRTLILRLYRMNAGLPDGKFPRDINQMSDPLVVAYARLILGNARFWNELPEKISYQTTDFSGAVPELKKGAKYQTKDQAKKEMVYLLKILERDMNMVYRAPEPNPRE